MRVHVHVRVRACVRVVSLSLLLTPSHTHSSPSLPATVCAASLRLHQQLLRECRRGGGRWIMQRRADVARVFSHAANAFCRRWAQDKGDVGDAVEQEEGEAGGGEEEEGVEDVWVELTVDYGIRCGMIDSDDGDGGEGSSGNGDLTSLGSACKVFTILVEKTPRWRRP